MNEHIPQSQASLVSSAMDKEEIVDVLNDLLELTRTGRRGFVAGAQEAETVPVLKEILQSRSRACAKAEVELVAMIRTFGFEPTRKGAAAAAQERDWLNRRGSVGTLGDASIDASILEACKIGEEAALLRYRHALDEQLPAHVRELLLQQLENVQHNHEKMEVLQDAWRQ